MRHALVSPTEVRRLSVHVDDISVDVALSATLPVGTLIPAITDALVATGKFCVGPAAVRFDLATPGDDVLDASKTLTELEIRDGTSLTLTRNSVELPTACFDDAAEAVSSAVAAVEQRWNRRATRLVSALVASCLAGASAALLWRSAFGAGDAHRAGCVGVAATISVSAVMASTIAYRLGEGSAGLASGLTATAFAALAGFVAVPGGPGAANAVFASAAAATSAILIRVIGRHTAIFTTLACFAAMCVTAAAICLITAAPLPAVGTGLAAVSLALIEASPSIAITLARLSPASIDDQLPTRAIQAHTWLTGLIAAFSASAALGAICALSEPSLPHILFATVSGSVLLLRSRTRLDIRHSAPSVMCGAATLGAALVAAAVAYPHLALHIASLSMMLSSTALYAGFMTSATTISSTARRSIELLHYFALAAVAPLALWLCGLYGAVRGLNLP